MSASLVGSEMCIRDRPIAVAPIGRRRPLRARGARASSGGAETIGRSLLCLLYTSDAADDM
eukprot:7926493-Alexandrium_andersonii.AAC.1